MLIMRIVLILLLLSFADRATAQAFHRTYGGWCNWPHMPFAASPDAYYLMQFCGGDSGDHLEFMKVGLDGDTLWTRRMLFLPYRLTYGEGAVYAGSEGTVVKFDTTGNVIWTNTSTYGGVLHYNSRIHVLPDGVLALGHRDYSYNGTNWYDITVTRFDADGNLLWGKIITSQTYSMSSLTSTIAPDGDIVLACYRRPAPGIDDQLMLARFSDTGDPIWMRAFTDGSDPLVVFTPSDLITTSDGRSALVGTSGENYTDCRAHVMMFDSIGNILWAESFRRDGWLLRGRSLIEDSQNRLVVAGSCTDIGGWGGLLMLRMDSDGAPLDAVSVGDIGNVYPPYYPTNPTGQDLVECIGTGYVVSSAYNPSGHAHGLVTIDYTGVPGCPELGADFPVITEPVAWSELSVEDIDTSSAISSSLISMNSETMPTSIFDLCPMVTSVPASGSRLSDFRISPVPATDALTCDWTQKATGIMHLELIDVWGRSIKHISSEYTAGPHRMIWPVADLARGMYHLRLTMDGRTTAQHVVLR